MFVYVCACVCAHIYVFMGSSHLIRPERRRKKVFVAESQEPKTNSQWVYLDVCICASFCVYNVCVYMWLLAVVSAVLH